MHAQLALAALPLRQKHPLPILYEAGRALALVSKGTENMALTAVCTSNRPVGTESL